MIGTELTDEEVADILAWSPDQSAIFGTSTLTTMLALWQSASGSHEECKPDLKPATSRR
jgi:hypothetical protein